MLEQVYVTCVIAAVCEDNKAVVMSDAAIGFDDGFRRLMTEGKWWDMKRLIIGESGTDFALSRIRQKTRDQDWEALRDPYTFSELVCQVQADVKGQLGMEALEAELLHVGADEDGNVKLYVIGGDGGISGPYPYVSIGHGMMPAQPLLDARFTRTKSRSLKTVKTILWDVLELTARYNESVEPDAQGNFFWKVYDPDEAFEAL